jgi:hypothetical protein
MFRHPALSFSFGADLTFTTDRHPCMGYPVLRRAWPDTFKPIVPFLRFRFAKQVPVVL